MNVYVWQSAKGITIHYHDDGGVVIVAGSLPEARKLFRARMSKDGVSFTAELESPDHVIPASNNAEPAVFIFPDSGCC